MDKLIYKQMLADEMSTINELRNKIEEIKTLVFDNPNNMELGEKVRNLFPANEGGENQIKLF